MGLMAESIKTINWETIFEHPNTGFVPLINLAETPDQLQECFHAVIDGLFTRDGDAAHLQEYKAAIDETFRKKRKASTLRPLKLKIMALLRRIKLERIERAEAYRMLAVANPVAASERRLPKLAAAPKLDMLDDLASEEAA